MAAECSRDPCSFAVCPGPLNRGQGRGGDTPSRTENAECIPDYCECRAIFIDEDDGEEIKCFGEGNVPSVFDPFPPGKEAMGTCCKLG